MSTFVFDRVRKVSLSLSCGIEDQTWDTATKLHPLSWGFFTLVMARKISVNSDGRNKGFIYSFNKIPECNDAWRET